MAGYFDEKGTKVTWSNPTITPESQRQSGGWYYNPSTGSVDRWWSGSNTPNNTTNNNFTDNNFNDLLNQSLNLYKQNSQPIIDSYNNLAESSKKLYETQRSGLQSQITPLNERYTSLLNQIKGNQQTAENRQTVTTRSELAKRGIPLTSTIANQEVTNAINPITQQYTELGKQTVSQQGQELAGINAAINNLYPQEQQTLAQIANQIATYNGGNFNNAISTAMNLLQNKQQNDIALRELALKEKTSANNGISSLLGNNYQEQMPNYTPQFSQLSPKEMAGLSSVPENNIENMNRLKEAQKGDIYPEINNKNDETVTVPVSNLLTSSNDKLNIPDVLKYLLNLSQKSRNIYNKYGI